MRKYFVAGKSKQMMVDSGQGKIRTPKLQDKCSLSLRPGIYNLPPQQYFYENMTAFSTKITYTDCLSVVNYCLII